MAGVSKEEYLKRYLSGTDADQKGKKKKKKRPKNPAQKIVQPRVKIVDDDVEFNSLLPENIGNTFEDDVGDNEPTVAEFVDERPDSVKQLESFRNDARWKTLGNDKSSSRFDSDSEEDASHLSRRRHDSDSDRSPTRNQRHDSDSEQSDSRRKPDSSSVKRKQQDLSDSDMSPSRARRHDSDSDTASRKRKKQYTRTSPSIKQRHDSDSDHSPPRKMRQDSDSDQSPPRKGRQDSDSDQSPPRGKRQDSDSDQSPLRRNKNGSASDQSPPRKGRLNSDSDESPPRKSSKTKGSSTRWDDNSDRDQIDMSAKRSGKNNADETDKLGRAKKTLSGQTAGLSSAKQMREEARKMREREDELFKQIGDEKLGKNAKTVVRKSKKRQEEEEEEKKDEARKAAIQAKYKKWNKGLKQQTYQQEKVNEALVEAEKSLTRHKDDVDMNDYLKQQDREGDPMLAFLKKKKAKKRGPVLPRYKGPEPPPNRFNIWPGYRWDGVDRSSGFEKKIYARKNERKATSEIAYKWSVEDM